ncbi:MAG: DUF6507 family protein [Actinocatenispora sp.]
MSYLDMHPDPVSRAGRNTAETATDWETWAGHSETLLRNAASGSGHGVVANAFETFLSDINPLLKSVAAQATLQGTNAAYASKTVADGDLQGAADLRRAGTELGGTHTVLSRPITGR